MYTEIYKCIINYNNLYYLTIQTNFILNSNKGQDKKIFFLSFV